MVIVCSAVAASRIGAFLCWALFIHRAGGGFCHEWLARQRVGGRRLRHGGALSCPRSPSRSDPGVGSQASALPTRPHCPSAAQSGMIHVCSWLLRARRLMGSLGAIRSSPVSLKRGRDWLRVLISHFQLTSLSPLGDSAELVALSVCSHHTHPSLPRVTRVDNSYGTGRGDLGQPTCC